METCESLHVLSIQLNACVWYTCSPFVISIIFPIVYFCLLYYPLLHLNFLLGFLYAFHFCITYLYLVMWASYELYNIDSHVTIAMLA